MKTINWKRWLSVFGVLAFFLILFFTGGKSLFWNATALGGLMIYFCLVLSCFVLSFLLLSCLFLLCHLFSCCVFYFFFLFCFALTIDRTSLSLRIHVLSLTCWDRTWTHSESDVMSIVSAEHILFLAPHDLAVISSLLSGLCTLVFVWNIVFSTIMLLRVSLLS